MNGRVGNAIIIILLISSGYYPLLRPPHENFLDPGVLNVSGSYDVHFPIHIDSDLDFPRLDFPGSGTQENPYRIENLYIFSDDDIALRIEDVDANFIIRNCYLKSNIQTFALIDIYNVQNTTVEDNILHGGMYGIRMQNVDNAIIENNSIVSSKEGFLAISCDGIEFNGNLVSHCKSGITAMSLTNSIFFENKIYRNTRVGVDIGGSSYNTFVENSIGWNGITEALYVNNAVDDGTCSSWHNNSWSDYSGYGDYEIDGQGEYLDSMPREFSDSFSPVNIPPDKITLTENVMWYNIFWNISDDFPYTYQIIRNGHEFPENEWTGNSESYSVDRLTMGTFNYTLIVTDVAGNTVSSFVIVTILHPLLTPEMIFSIGVMILTGIVVIYVIILRIESDDSVSQYYAGV